MRRLDLSLPTPAENLALDEVLLLEAEEKCALAGKHNSRCRWEVLRFWESAKYFVVLGAGGKVGEEVRVESCRADGIPILRRDSGGGTVLQGPGCLNFTLILDVRFRPECADISGTNHFVLSRIRSALASRWPEADCKGISDLALGNRKFCGTAQRRKRSHILFHGAILYHFDLSRIGRYLAHPPKEPAYRAGRPHHEFVTNLPATAEELRRLIAGAWCASQVLQDYSADRVAELVVSKYSNPRWNERF
ncbi:MAG: lipoate--protein ligase family protein [Candidatus Sumerlaeaceae bacterium]|nr:lipoate--protein ligase family protein [Candidatus Sumerlaeaceae bacterium]